MGNHDYNAMLDDAKHEYDSLLTMHVTDEKSFMNRHLLISPQTTPSIGYVHST